MWPCKLLPQAGILGAQHETSLGAPETRNPEVFDMKLCGSVSMYLFWVESPRMATNSVTPFKVLATQLLPPKLGLQNHQERTPGNL